MAKELNNIAIPVTDLDAAKKLYTALLGAEPFADSPYYVGYMAEGVQIGLDPNGHAHGHGQHGLHVVDIDDLVQLGLDLRHAVDAKSRDAGQHGLAHDALRLVLR